MTSTLFELFWGQQLLCDLGVCLHVHLVLSYDNVSAIYLSHNPVFHGWIKHIEVDFHLIRESVVAKTLCA